MSELPPPLALRYAVTQRLRPVALVAPGAVAVEEPLVPGPDLTLADVGPVAPFAAVELRVEGAAAGAAVGLATDDDTQVVVRCTRRSLVLEVRRDGRTRVLRRRRFTPPGSFGLAFALCENQVTALVDTGTGWQPVLTERDRVRRWVDLRDEATLRRFRYAWQVMPTGSDGLSGQVRGGVFGWVGLRDPHLVQHADGTPFERDGRRYLTWTAAGLGFFAQAHWTVWSFDPADPASMRPEAHLFFRRDGRVLGDHAGHLVRDGDRWLVAVSSWGDFDDGPVHVRHLATDTDLLHGVHVLEAEPVALPTQHGTWDPALLRHRDRWLVAFVESQSQDPFRFHPAVASTSAADWTSGLGLELRAGGSHQSEGPMLLSLDGEVWLLASDQETRSYPVRDLSGRLHGRLDAPYPTNIPHPQVVDDPRGGWWLVTFDGTPFDRRVMGYGGHGDVVVMHSLPEQGRAPR